MYWKLTDNILWGDFNSVLELKDQVGSVICLATNGDLLERGYNPLILPAKVRYFRMAERDMTFPDATYIKSLEDVIKVSLRYKPLLVHCYVGQHRSPIIAVMAALIDSDDYSTENYMSLLSKVLELRPDCAEVMHFNFSKQMQTYMKMYMLKCPVCISSKLEEVKRLSEK